MKDSDLMSEIFTIAKQRGTNNCVTRQLCETTVELDKMDRPENITTEPIRASAAGSCYGCNKTTLLFHGNYVYSCVKCGTKFQENRYIYTSQEGKVAVVTGGRTKLGHQVCLKLLRAGAVVFATTRFPDKARDIYTAYPDYSKWENNLHLYALDMDVPNLAEEFNKLATFISGWTTNPKVDILVNCAAQTIRCREKKGLDSSSIETNRYADDKFVKSDQTIINSWNMLLPDLVQSEMEELFRINAIAPVLLTQALLFLLKQSEGAYIINVHAKEGLINAHKTAKHMHTNMAKVAMAMFTRVLPEHSYVSDINRNPFSIHGCDPGWISIDEYELNGSPWITAPLDEVDGAARVLFPLWKMRSTNYKTRRHFTEFST